MSHRCNLSTSAVRDNVSARKPPIQPTPITPTSTVFTGHFPRFLRGHKDHDAAGRAMLWTVTLRGSRHRSRDAPLRPSVAKPCHVKREGRGGYGKRGVVPLFLYSLRPSRQSQEIKKEIKEAERRQTLINIRRILRCGARLARRARLSAFHRGSHLRELFHPKGSASGQASWDAV